MTKLTYENDSRILHAQANGFIMF